MSQSYGDADIGLSGNSSEAAWLPGPVYLAG